MALTNTKKETNIEIVSERLVDDFLNTEVKNYALYVIQSRAIPNIMDGLRIGARKILWAAIKGELKSQKKIKMVNLIGDTAKFEFHHGDASLKNTIEQLGSSHLFNVAPLNIIGQKPSLRVPDCSTAARYLHVAKTEFLDLFKADYDLLKLIVTEGKLVEPKFFLPIIPITLLWRTNSPGYGFSFRSFSFDLNDVIEATVISLLTGTCSNELDSIVLRPRIEGIKPENIIYNQNKESWYNTAEYKVIGDLLIVTDLPFNVSFTKYTDHLNMLKEKNIIADWQNMKDKENPIKYLIKFHKDKLSILYSQKWKFYTTMRLFTKIPKLTLNTIDTDCKSILFFDTPNQLIDAFVKKRLTVYNDRKTRLIDIINKNIAELTDKVNFIQLIVDNKLIINKRKIEDIKLDCIKFKVSNDGLKLPISKLTQEEINKSLLEIKELNNELIYIKNTTIKEMYLNDLIALKQKHSIINQPKV